MTRLEVGRNAPCLCGSGRKFKKCCLGKDASGATVQGAAAVTEEIRQAVAGREFESLQEVQAFVDSYMRRRNRAPLKEFHELSPDQMHRVLHFPFSSPDLVRFAGVLEQQPAAPALVLFDLLANGIGEGGLKPTATGNLPRRFCRDAARAYWGEETYRENTRFGGINSEPDFSELHVVRLAAGLAGLVRKYKGRFILGRDCRARLREAGSAALYPPLLRAYVERFNWGYRDRYPELRFIQTSFVFTLYLLVRYGDTARPHVFYEDNFLRAFPQVLDEVPPNTLLNPEKQVRSCYTLRTLIRFAAFFGLAAVEPVSDDILCREYRVQAKPLLREVVTFHVAG